MYMCVANMNVPSSIAVQFYAQHLQTERQLDMMLLIQSMVIAPLSSQEQQMHVSAEISIYTEAVTLL